MVTRSRLIELLQSRQAGRSADPEVRIATGPSTSEPCSVEFVQSDDGYGPHIRLSPDPGHITPERKRELIRYAVASAIEADLWAPEKKVRPGEMRALLEELEAS